MMSHTTSRLRGILCLFGVLIFQRFATGQDTNVALNKTATQSADLDYLFFWTADKAVDGCLLRDDPDNQQCCSGATNEGGVDVFWTVNLEQQYLVSRIVVTGRLADFSNQLEAFAVYTKQEDFFPELQVYNNVGQPYNDGVFIVDIPNPSPVQYVTLRRPTGTLMVICEVEVFAVIEDTPTTTQTPPPTTTTAMPTTQTPTTSTVTTTEAVCPVFTFGELCSPCGNCLNNEPCDPSTGTCASGCAAGYVGTICDIECPAGLYGPGCSGVCANCLNGDVCDGVTGQCPSGCEPGWTGVLCDQTIPTVQPTTIETTSLPSTAEPSTQESTTTVTYTNVALNKTATQSADLDYLFFWTADKAVDGCLLRDDPDNQQCCSGATNEGGVDVFWTVNLEQQYIVSRIVVTGRLQDFSNQIENFAVYTKQEDFFPELQVYDNVGQPYNDGIFIIDIPNPSPVQYVTLRRPTGTLMVICEVEVFAVTEDTSTTTQTATTSTTAIPTTSTPTTSTVTTTEAVCPVFTFGELCSPCGNCLNNEPCDPSTGTCSSGCAAGYFGTLCDIECPAGLYGPGCFGVCANCLNGDVCDGVTGQCPSGCEPGWTGALCDQNIPIVTSTTVETTSSPGTSESSTQESTTTVSYTNVALNKTATQSADLAYLFFWTADKAVDGCLLRDDPDNQQCCSGATNEGGVDVFWTVNLEQQYLVSRIVVSGRLQDSNNQIENFAVYTKQDDFFPELQVYNNVGQPYNDGIFTIDIPNPSPVQYVTLRRPTAALMVICEVEVFAVIEDTPTTSQTPPTPPPTTTTTTAMPTTQTPTTSTVTTTEAVCPVFTFGELCSPCGNCLNNEPCDSSTGTCASGCAAGYFGAICDIECPAGLYGPGCFGVCANCLNGDVCDSMTGQCPAGCEPGWTGPLCDQSTPIVTSTTVEPTTTPGTSEPSTQESTTAVTYTNVALNKTATQSADLDYLFFWTADKAVDGCLLRDDPDNQQCCSGATNEGGVDVFWTVNLEQQYLVSRIVVTGRLQDFSDQIANFSVYTKQEDFFPELQVYNNVGQPYNDGIFTIDIPKPSPVQYVTLRRPTAALMVICEVEVLAIIEDTSSTTQAATTTTTTTTTTTAMPTTQTPTTSTVTTTEAVCPVFTFGELCSPCGNCLNNEPCDPSTGTCSSGCAAGYFGTLCDIECPAGLYGPGCFGVCANCLNGDVCDGVTGQCPSGCEPGWTGPLCDQSIPIVTSTTTETTASPSSAEPSTQESTTTVSYTNVALNKTATQSTDLDYLFFWTADKAVDGCLLRDDPDNQQCCSGATNEGGVDVFWTVNLEQQYLVSRIVVTGRLADSSNQLESFAVYTKQEDFFPELQVYDNVGQPYNDGIFIIDIPNPSLVQYVTLRRPTGTLMVICEVEVFAVLEGTTTTVQTTTMMPTTPTTTQSPTTSTVIEDTTTKMQTTTMIPITSTTQSPTTSTDTNVALNKTATQSADLDYLFFWTADKAVDGCLLRDDPDNQQCCSGATNEGGVDVFWTVNLEQQYLVSRIVVTGRLADSSNQLESFAVYTKQEDFFPELQVYDNVGQPYNDGIFIIDIPNPSPVQYVTLRRPTGTLMVICEVEVFAVLEDTTTTVQTTTMMPTTPTTTQSPTTSTVIEDTTTKMQTTTMIPITSTTQSPTTSTDTNVALNKTATQSADLDYLFFWTADKAVDGCLLRDDPDNQQCCSGATNEGGVDVFWTVNLEQQYLVSRIVVTGRLEDSSNQLESFAVYTKQEDFFPELQVYDNVGQPYNDGIFIIDIPNPSPVQYVTLRRPTGTLMVICEVEVFAVLEDTTTTVQTTTMMPTTPTTQSPTTSTAIPTVPSTPVETTSSSPSTSSPSTSSPSTSPPSTSSPSTSSPSTSEPPTQEPTTSTAYTNIALNKTATQSADLDYLFFWTADKAVDGCLLRDDPDNQQCCSGATNEGGVDVFWTVNLEQQYLVSRIVVTGRLQDFSNQIENFAVYTKQEDFFPELQVYNNVGQPYNDGIFTIDIPNPSPVQYVTLRLPTAALMVICEVEVFAADQIETTPTPVSTQSSSQTPTQSSSQAPTQSSSQAPTQSSSQAPTQTSSQAPTQSSSQAPTQSSSQTPTQSSSQASTQSSSQAPTQSSSQAPTQSSSQAPTQSSSQAPTQSSSQAPTQSSSQAPTQSSSQAPTQSSSQAPTQSSSEAPTQSSSQAPTQSSSQAPTQSSSQAPTQSSSQAPTQSSSQAPTQSSSLAPTQSSSQATTESSSQVPTQSSSQAPTQSSSQVPTQSSSQAPTQSSSQVPTQSSSQAPTQSSSQVPTQSSSQAPTQSSSQAPTQSSSQAPTQSSSQAPTQSSSQAPTQSSSQAPTQSSSQAPTQSSSQAPTQGSTDFPIQRGDANRLAPILTSVAISSVFVIVLRLSF